MLLHFRVVSLLALLTCAAGATQAFALSADEVFERVSKSVVRINDIDSHGTGIVISRDGTILTNYHVVSMAIDLSVTATVTQAGRPKVETFENVRVIGVHPTYDLALLKVDAPGSIFHEVKYSTQVRARTGEKVYVIGNPGGAAGTSLDNSISDGIISSLSRNVGGLDYIQTNAAINPGNSGGPLLNEHGALLGVVTLKLDQREGIGFAIPISAYKRHEFSSVDKRRNDPETAQLIAQEAYKIFKQSERVLDRNQAMAMQAYAGSLFRIAAAEDPGNPTYIYNTGVGIFAIGEVETAFKYFEKAYELDNNHSGATYRLGVRAHENGDNKTAIEFWRKSAANEQGDRSLRSYSIEALAILAFEDNDYSTAAYCISWSDTMHRPHDSLQQRREIRIKSMSEINRTQRAHLRQTRDYSLEDLATFVSLKSTDNGSSTNEREIPSMPDKAADAINDKLKEQRDAHIKQLTSRPTAFVDDTVEIKTNGSVMYVEPAYGGLYLALTYGNNPNVLDVYDLHTGEHAFEIPLRAADPLIAAGGNRLLVYYSKFRVVELWDLKTREMESARRLKFPDRIHGIEMGLDDDNRALFATAGDPDVQRSGLTLRYIDLNTLDDLFVPYEADDQVVYNRQCHLRINRTGTLFSVSNGRHSGAIGRIDKDGITLQPVKDIEGTILMGAGDVAYSTNGWMIHANGMTVEPAHKSIRYFPVIDSEGVHLFNQTNSAETDREFIAYDVQTKRPVAKIVSPVSMARRIPSRMSSNSDRYVTAVASINRVAFYDDGNRRLYIKKITLPKKGVVEVAAAKPGRTWSRKLSYGQGAKAQLINAPDGVTFDAKTFELKWAVPAGTEPGVYEVMLLVTPPGAPAEYQQEAIVVTD